MAELDWFFSRHVLSFGVFVCAGDIILERDFYISVSPASFTDKSDRLKLRHSCSDQSQTLVPIFAQRLLKGSVAFGGSFSLGLEIWKMRKVLLFGA
jgi:hypothetical protein